MATVTGGVTLLPISRWGERRILVNEPHVIGVEMRQQSVVENRRWPRMEVLDVPCYPLTRSARVVRLSCRVGDGLCRRTGIDQQCGTVRKNDERRISFTRADVMDIEDPLRPWGETSTNHLLFHLLGSHGRERGHQQGDP